LKPDLNRPSFAITCPGTLSGDLQNAQEDAENFYALVIDEINRGDPGRIFGELLYGIEYRGEAVSLALGGELVVPPNLIILGT